MEERTISTHVFDGRHGKLVFRVVESKNALWVCEHTTHEPMDLPPSEKEADDMDRRRWRWSIGSQWAHEANMRRVPCYLVEPGRQVIKLIVTDGGSLECAEVELDVKIKKKKPKP